MGVFSFADGIRWSKVLIFAPNNRRMYASPLPSLWDKNKRSKSDDACATFIIEAVVDYGSMLFSVLLLLYPSMGALLLTILIRTTEQ